MFGYAITFSVNYFYWSSLLAPFPFVLVLEALALSSLRSPLLYVSLGRFLAEDSLPFIVLIWVGAKRKLFRTSLCWLFVESRMIDSLSYLLPPSSYIRLGLEMELL